VVLFQIITLPVELNASRRALKILEGRNILYSDELKGARSVLSAAAMTYVAAALTAIANLLRLIYISRDRN
jgi:Zn-dependent membrane protease YugP